MKIDINLKNHPTDLTEIYSVICQMSNVDIRDKTRKRNYVDARNVFYGISRKLTMHSHAVIGGFLNRDHATSVHGTKMFKILMASDQKFRDATRFALYKCCNLLDKIAEDPRDFVFLNWSKITNEQQSKMKDQMVYFLNTNTQIKVPSYA
tara:strand:- start:1145 stop:1594 length:450 start_codon:yes stop_codon:yes gene_type:complete